MIYFPQCTFSHVILVLFVLLLLEDNFVLGFWPGRATL